MPDDLRLHRHEQGQQLLLAGFLHLELVHGRDQVIDKGIEVGAGQVQATVRLFHATAGIRARSTGRRAHLFDHQLTQVVVVDLEKQTIDAGIAVDPGQECVDHTRDAFGTTQFAVQSVPRAGAVHGFLHRTRTADQD